MSGRQPALGRDEEVGWLEVWGVGESGPSR